MTDFAVLLDAPGSAESTLQIAKLGTFTDPRYGEFSITEADVASWKTSLSLLPGGKAPIDLDHRSEKTGPERDTSAAGWINDIDLVDGVPQAKVEWTDLGEDAIASKRYLFFSPAFGKHKVEGKVHEGVLAGGALTNKPFLNMATIQLADEDNVRRALLAELPAEDVKKLLEGMVGSASDSPPPMPVSAEIAKALGVAEDADEKTVLEAITELAERETPAPPETITLDEQAAKDGKVVLDNTEYAELKAGAEMGREAKRELDEQRFESAFTAAVSAHKVAPAQRESIEAVYAINKDAALKLLEDAPAILPGTPSGRNHTTFPDAAPSNAHEGSFLLDVQVKKYMADHEMNPATDYKKALDAMYDEGLITGEAI